MVCFRHPLHESQHKWEYVGGIWMWMDKNFRALTVASIRICVYLCACVKESKQRSQGAVSREPGCRLITGLHRVWCLLGTDSFSPHGSPFSHPFFAPCSTLSLYRFSSSSISFPTHYFLRLSLHPTDWEGVCRSTLAISRDWMRRHMEISKQGFVGNNPERVSL